MSKHTPGPWILRKWKSEVGAHAVDATDPSDGQNFGVCDVWGINNDKVLCDISAANARLIAAAPELLEALRELADGYSMTRAKYAREIIAKATGEQS